MSSPASDNSPAGHSWEGLILIAFLLFIVLMPMKGHFKQDKGKMRLSQFKWPTALSGCLIGECKGLQGQQGNLWSSFLALQNHKPELKSWFSSPRKTSTSSGSAFHVFRHQPQVHGQKRSFLCNKGLRRRKFKRRNLRLLKPKAFPLLSKLKLSQMMYFFPLYFLMDLFLVIPFPEVIPFLGVILRLWFLVVSLFQQPPWPSEPVAEIWDGS